MTQFIFTPFLFLLTAVDVSTLLHEEHIDQELYRQTIDGREISFIAKTDRFQVKTYWNLYLSSLENKQEILLETDSINHVYEGFDNTLLQGDFRLSKIIGDAAFIDGDLYVVMDNSNHITLKIFELNNDGTFNKQEYYLTNGAFGSYVNFGHSTLSATVKKITSNDVFISLFSSTEVVNLKPEQLFSFNTSSKSIHEFKFEKTDELISAEIELTPESDNVENLNSALAMLINNQNNKFSQPEAEIIGFLFDQQAMWDYVNFNKVHTGDVYVFYNHNEKINVARYSLYKKGLRTGKVTKEVIEQVMD